uniref:GAG-pre-integrase domain-containing protein n=1 Tax=Chenopodium quinoa TaxID=63459 RepID=A0A803LXV2_CHEQI
MATYANNVFYLHPNDGSYSISVDKLTRASDYRSWRRSMEIALTSKKKIGFVLGTVIRSTYAADAVKADQWDTCNSMVISWIHACLSDTIKKSVLYVNTARETWVQLEKRLWEELVSMNAFPVISEMSAEVRTLLNTVARNQEESRLFQFLNGLDDHYGAMRSQMLMLTPLPTVESACSMLQQEESQRDVLISKVDTDIFAMYSRQFPAKPSVTCSHCGGKGHNQSKCWPKMAAAAQVSTVEGDGWIIDSGASDHMTYDLSKFADPKPAGALPRITLPTGDSASISHIGVVNLCNSLNLHNVPCVPKFKYNLLSVPKLTKDSHCEVNFYGTHCVIRDTLTKKIKGVGRAKNGLYYLVNQPLGADLLTEEQNIHTCLAAQNEYASVPFAVWHHRLGHASLKKLQHIPCVKKIIKENSQIFVTCHMEKFTKLPYQLMIGQAVLTPGDQLQVIAFC